MEVVVFTPEQWEPLSEKFHLVCFDTHKPKEWDRIDFALVAESGDELNGYVTCREHDAQTLYWQFGGAFPGTRQTSLSWKAYQAFGLWAQDKYKRITTLIENENIVMLKMAFKLGFRIIGVRVHKGSVLCELVLEFP